jgi:hypothetical protein
MVRNLAERDCVPIVEGKRGCVMFVMSPPAHNTPVHCRPSGRRMLLDVMCGAGSCSSGSGQPGDVLWHAHTHVHCRHPVNAIRCWDVMCGARSLLPQRDEVVGA